MSEQSIDGETSREGVGRSASREGWNVGLDALVLFGLLLGFYHVNGALMLANDITGNVGLAISVLNEGNLTFTVEEFPNMFDWSINRDGEWESVYVHSWDANLGGHAVSELLKQGQLRYEGPQYFLAQSPWDGEFVNDYGIGSSLTALPFFAAAHAVVGDLREYTMLAYYVGKFVAAASVAGSAVFVFLTAALYLPRNSSLVVAMTYALGTCVWSASSQGLWQHGPTELYLAMGAYFLLRAHEADRFAVYAGLSIAMAVLCRPTSFALAVVAAAVLLRADRRRFAFFTVAGSVIGLCQVIYNYTHLGSVVAFGQTVEMADIAMMKTGNASVWQFNLLESAAGLLVSPSRGLFVYSPVMIFAMIGMVQAWRDERYAALRPFSIAFAITALIHFSWYDWWGGWSYGYRPLVDTMVYLALFLIPVMAWLWQQKAAAAAFGVALAWSFFVQALGAFASGGYTWNARLLYEVEVYGGRQIHVLTLAEAQRYVDEGIATSVIEISCDVDRPECRHRLWSLSDNQIAFYVQNFTEERNRKRYQSSFSRVW